MTTLKQPLVKPSECYVALRIRRLPPLTDCNFATFNKPVLLVVFGEIQKGYPHSNHCFSTAAIDYLIVSDSPSVSHCCLFLDGRTVWCRSSIAH